MRLKALFLTSLSGRGKKWGKKLTPLDQGRAGGGEGGIQDNIQIEGLKSSIWLQLSLNSILRRLRPGFDLRSTVLRSSESQKSAPEVCNGEL